MGQIQYQRLWLIFMDIDSTIHIYFFIRHIVPWLMTIRKYDHAILGSRSRSRASIVCPWVSTRGIIHLILTQVCSVGLPQYDQQILSSNYKYGHRHIKCLTLRIYSTSRWTIEIKGYQLCLWTCQPIDSYGLFVSSQSEWWAQVMAIWTFTLGNVRSRSRAVSKVISHIYGHWAIDLHSLDLISIGVTVPELWLFEKLT